MGAARMRAASQLHREGLLTRFVVQHQPLNHLAVVNRCARLADHLQQCRAQWRSGIEQRLPTRAGSTGHFPSTQTPTFTSLRPSRSVGDANNALLKRLALLQSQTHLHVLQVQQVGALRVQNFQQAVHRHGRQQAAMARLCGNSACLSLTAGGTGVGVLNRQRTVIGGGMLQINPPHC